MQKIITCVQMVKRRYTLPFPFDKTKLFSEIASENPNLNELGSISLPLLLVQIRNYMIYAILSFITNLGSFKMSRLNFIPVVVQLRHLICQTFLTGFI